ncbi:MAG: hypothetical protein V3V75_02605 [Thermoguttaceae bacterium]
MFEKARFNLTGLLLGVVMFTTVVVGLVSVFLIDFSGSGGSGLPQGYDYDLTKYRHVDPALIHYEQTAEIPLAMQRPRAVAVGPDDMIYVTGDAVVEIFDSAGNKQAKIELPGQGQCIAVGGNEYDFPGRVYVGVRKETDSSDKPNYQLAIFDPQGQPLASWDDLGGALLTSIALAEEDVFLADAAGRVVLRFDTSGKLLGRLGLRDERRHIPGFAIPSPYFDVAMAPDGLLNAVNPGRLRIEAYTFDGDLEASWGKAGVDIAGFCGCCNPSNIAIMADGRTVTAEKGIFRVKVYDAEGNFQCVVAGPELLTPNPTAAEETRTPHKPQPVDLATDSKQRILVLDPNSREVRIFELKKTQENSE